MRRTARITVLIGLAVAASAPLHAQAPQPPQWLQQINPGDYALLAADLVQGLAFEGDINAEAQAVELGVTDAQGQTSVQQSFVFNLIQAIGAAQGDEAGAVSIYVAVLGTPAEAIAFTREHFGDYGMNPDWMVNANELGDRRITATGGSVTGPGRVMIRYRNIFANFSWNGAINDFGTAKTVQVAKLWLKKVAGPPGADLVITASDIVLKHWSDHAGREREAAADKQYVGAWLKNNSPDVTAKNVRARLSVQLEGEADYAVIGAPVLIGDVAPGDWGTAEFEWDLKGNNVVNADLRVDVWAEGPQDLDPRNNSAGIRCEIYYAYNGSQAYRWLEDSYQFRNYGYKGRELEEVVEGLLATVVGQLYTDPKSIELLNHLLFPQTYMRFYEYLYESIQSGAGGHCYGMAATAGLYFMDPAASPTGTATWNLSHTVAGPNINLYQRAQMLPLAEALLRGDTWMERNWGSNVTLNTVRQFLRSSRTPVLLSLAGTRKVQEQVMVNGQPQQQLVDKGWGHAVLAYKVVEVFGRTSAVYVYDPNLSPSLQWGGQAPMSAFSISPRTGDWTQTSDMAALYNRPAGHPKGEMSLDWIAAREFTRTVSVAESNAIMPDLRAKLKEMSKFLANAKRVMAVLRCPADVVFTDQQGRHVGEIGGVPINEVPGAQIRTSGDVEIYLLPSGLTWSVAITGTGAGQASFDIIRPEDGDPAITSFQDIPVSAGSSAAGTLKPQGAIEALSVAGATRAPTLTGTLSGDQVTWQEPATPTAPVTPGTETWSFADASASRKATMPIPTAGGELSLEFRYSKPGTLFDTVGILAAAEGTHSLRFFEDGTVTWQIMGRGVQSSIRHATGWHYMTGQAALQPGRWHTVRVTWGPGGMSLRIDGRLIGSDPAVLSLADVPLYFGDFPPDGKPQGFVGEIRNVNVTAWQGGEG